MMALAACFTFDSCGKSHEYDASVKQLDSLKVVVEQSLDNFSALDSARYYEALCRQSTYTSFIREHLHDTVTKVEAEALQVLYNSGKPFKNFFGTRQALIAEARTSATQLRNLSQDLAGNAVPAREAINYISDETKEAEKIIGLLKTNTSLLRRQMEDFTRSLPVVEALIKQHHAGTLPALTNPEL